MFLTVFFSGWLTAFAIAWLQVYLAGRFSAQQAALLESAGLVTVPLGEARIALTDPLHSAVAALLLAGTLGLMICMLAGSVLSLSQIVPRVARSWFWRLLLVFMVGAGLVLARLQVSLFLLAYILLIPGVMWGAAWWHRDRIPRIWLLQVVVVYVMIIVLGVLAGKLPAADGFQQVRQSVLARSLWGQQLIDTYYRYTLYAAEPLKTLAQKPVRPIRVEWQVESSEQRRVEAVLRRHLYWPYESNAELPGASLVVSEAGLLFHCPSRDATFTSTLNTLFAQGGQELRRLSDACDTQRWLRQGILWGASLGPLLLILWSLTAFLLWMFGALYQSAVQRRLRLLALFCLAALMLLSVQFGGWLDAQNNTWLTNYHLITAEQKYPHGPASTDLWAYTQSDSLYLRARAYRALGERTDSLWHRELLIALGEEPQWFVQWEIYRALLRQGWHPLVD